MIDRADSCIEIVKLAYKIPVAYRRFLKQVGIMICFGGTSSYLLRGVESLGEIYLLVEYMIFRNFTL